MSALRRSQTRVWIKLDYSFSAALGGMFPASDPNPHEFELEYTPKIQLDIPRGPKSGGCG